MNRMTAEYLRIFFMDQITPILIEFSHRHTQTHTDWEKIEDRSQKNKKVRR